MRLGRRGGGSSRLVGEAQRGGIVAVIEKVSRVYRIEIRVGM